MVAASYCGASNGRELGTHRGHEAKPDVTQGGKSSAARRQRPDGVFGGRCRQNSRSTSPARRQTQQLVFGLVNQVADLGSAEQRGFRRARVEASLRSRKLVIETTARSGSVC